MSAAASSRSRARRASRRGPSDPDVHAALSASAGTGKTQVLTARVLRLLLQRRAARIDPLPHLHQGGGGGDGQPHRRAARGLGAAARTASLRTDLISLGEVQRSADARARPAAVRQGARRPGGLRIQTIHSFAQSLLAAFPAEAGIVPGFQPIEGRAEQELVRRTLANLLADAEARGDEALIRDVQCLSRAPRRGGRGRLSEACAREPEALAALGPADGIEPQLRGLMDLPEGSVEDYHRRPLRRRPASTATCCARSPRPTASGARRPGSAMPRRSRSGWR